VGKATIAPIPRPPRGFWQPVARGAEGTWPRTKDLVARTGQLVYACIRMLPDAMD